MSSHKVMPAPTPEPTPAHIPAHIPDHAIKAARVSVRPTVQADWPVLKAVRLAALADASTAFGVSHAEALANPDSQWMARAAGTGPGRFFLAFQDERAIGMAASVRHDDGRASLIAMWVAPAARGMGAADLLVDAVKARAAADGARDLILEVAPGNARAVDFYRRHGFRFQSHREALASHPHIELQRMGWHVVAAAGDGNAHSASAAPAASAVARPVFDPVQ